MEIAPRFCQSYNCPPRLFHVTLDLGTSLINELVKIKRARHRPYKMTADDVDQLIVAMEIAHSSIAMSSPSTLEVDASHISIPSSTPSMEQGPEVAGDEILSEGSVSE